MLQGYRLAAAACCCSPCTQAGFQEIMCHPSPWPLPLLLRRCHCCCCCWDAMSHVFTRFNAVLLAAVLISTRMLLLDHGLLTQ